MLKERDTLGFTSPEKEGHILNTSRCHPVGLRSGRASQSTLRPASEHRSIPRMPKPPRSKSPLAARTLAKIEK